MAQARLVVDYRRGSHSHSRQHIHGLPARYRAVPRGPAAAQWPLTILIPKTGEPPPYWVKSSVSGGKVFLLKTPRKEQVWIFGDK